MVAIDDIPTVTMDEDSAFLTIQLLLMDTVDIISASKCKGREEVIRR
jgi:hypothetical protein